MKNKLLYITNGINGPGGLERVLSIKASYLAEKFDYSVHILTLNQPTESLFYEFSNQIKFHNITAIGNPLKYFFNYQQKIKKIIKKIDPDIIIVCDDGLKGLFFPFIFGKNRPIIYERHVSKKIEVKTDNSSIFNQKFNNLKFKLMDFGGSFFDKFIVLTNGNLNEWNLKNIKVIPNPLSFYPETQSNLEHKIVIAVGKQSFQKGYDRLLKSWKKVSKNHPDWILNIYGTINSDQKLVELTKELNIAKSVNFFPPTKNIAEKYKESSIYVMSSRYEGFGMVLTEAMAYGVPCVSFDCPHGPSDIITHGKDGFIVANHNTNDLAQHINILIKNKTKRKQMGTAAKENVKRYLPEKIVMEWDNLFKSLINN